MHIDPVVISVVALSVSALGFLHSLYTGSIQRRLQVERNVNFQAFLKRSLYKTSKPIWSLIIDVK